MADETERPEDMVRRFAFQIQELEAWRAKYREAAELWDALELKNNQHVVGAILIAKGKDFVTGNVVMTTARTDDVDWVDKIGMTRVALQMFESEEIIDE
jgi:hypothetical protein